MSKAQLIGMCDRIITNVLNRIAGSFFERHSAPICLSHLSVSDNSRNPIVSLKDILDGIVFATPKSRTPLRKIWRRKYGDDNWHSGGTKLYKAKRNITTCSECGTFHEFHTICRTCFKKVQDESNEIIEKIRATWSRGVIDKEVQILYKGESAPGPNKRIVEMDKPRPLWFASNLSQKTARPIGEIAAPPVDFEDRTIKIKE